MKSASTYRAVQAVSKGKLELTEKPLVDPPAGHVRIRVEACGVCHSDSATVEGILPIAWPRVPGHEAVGRIEVIGNGVEGWKVGQRVGVGFLGGSCGYCDYCRDGDLVNCTNQGYTGVQQDGGYAELAYRPTKLDNDSLRNLEMIFRWDHLSRDPSGLGDPEETRWTLGLNYWLSPSTVLKVAYEWDQPNGEPNRNALLIQTAMGF